VTCDGKDWKCLQASNIGNSQGFDHVGGFAQCVGYSGAVSLYAAAGTSRLCQSWSEPTPGRDGVGRSRPAALEGVIQTCIHIL